MDLSVIIITMNRKEKVCKAISSCLNSDIPNQTEFIIVDNGSTDGTEVAVKRLFNSENKSLTFIRFENNTGASFARNEAIKESNSDIVFFLDDDAFIPEKYHDCFFTKGMRIINSNQKVGALTTSVWDVALNKWRIPKRAKTYSKEPVETSKIYEVHGGSCFVRKCLIGDYFPKKIKYGYEEVFMCLRLLDAGFLNCETEEISVIHDPEIIKWFNNGKITKEHSIKMISGLYSVKKMLYPRILLPCVWIGFNLRWLKTMGVDLSSRKEILRLHREQCSDVKYSKIRMNTIYFLFKEFGLSYVI